MPRSEIVKVGSEYSSGCSRPSRALAVSTFEHVTSSGKRLSDFSQSCFDECRKLYRSTSAEPVSCILDESRRGVVPHRHLDEIDYSILNLIQDHGRISNVEMADRVGLSPAPCLRRVQA